MIRLFYQLADFFDFFATEILIRGVEESCDEVLGFPLKKGVKEAFECRALCFAFGDHGGIKIASPIFGMFHHFLIFESGKERSDCRIGGRIGEFLEDILGGGFTQTIENIENLTLAAGDLTFFQTIHELPLSSAGKTAMEMLEK
jgi:hypothetical protein